MRQQRAFEWLRDRVDPRGSRGVFAPALWNCGLRLDDGPPSLIAQLEERTAIDGAHDQRGCERVDRELQQGEYLAVDVFLTGRCAEVTMWRTVERITLDPEDRGVVYDVGGKAVGSVLDGSTPPYVTLAMTQDELLAAAEQHEG